MKLRWRSRSKERESDARCEAVGRSTPRRLKISPTPIACSKRDGRIERIPSCKREFVIARVQVFDGNGARGFEGRAEGERRRQRRKFIIAPRNWTRKAEFEQWVSLNFRFCGRRQAHKPLSNLCNDRQYIRHSRCRKSRIDRRPKTRQR